MARKGKQLAVGNWHLAKTKKNKSERQNSEKQSVHGKQAAKTRKNKGRKSKQLALPKTRLTHFRELKGKIIEDVLFSAAPDHQDITIKLQDKTGLSFSIATGLILKTEYSDWTSGEQRILRSWVLKKQPLVIS